MSYMLGRFNRPKPETDETETVQPSSSNTGLTPEQEKMLDAITDWKIKWFEKEEGLNPHQSEFFSWYLEQCVERIWSWEETLFEVEKSLENFDVLAEAEMERVALLSDVAIELRWTRLEARKARS